MESIVTLISKLIERVNVVVVQFLDGKAHTFRKNWLCAISDDDDRKELEASEKVLIKCRLPTAVLAAHFDRVFLASAERAGEI